MKLVVDCPPLSQPVFVDREMWEKIVLNLLSNAFKFTFEGAITVRLHEADNEVQLMVIDTGTGIPANELPNLFERFYRVKDAGGRSFEGSGIGLALVTELVKLHGGRVEVQSEPASGSTFIVTLPMGQAHLPADRIRNGQELVLTDTAGNYVPAGSPAMAAPTGGDALAPMAATASIAAALSDDDITPLARVLLVDDNIDMRTYLQKLMNGRYEVMTATDGEDALALMDRHPFDLVLTDVMMPRLDGFAC